jgi:hypothetical protein
MTKISLEQKNVNEIINTYEKAKRKFEEDLSGINLTRIFNKISFFLYFQI